MHNQLWQAAFGKGHTFTVLQDTKEVRLTFSEDQ